jgi:hypothetical protein
MKFKSAIETIIDKKIKSLWSDWGGELLSKEFQEFLDQHICN